MKKISLTIPLAFATTAEQLTKSILDNQKAIQELSNSQGCSGPADSIDAWTKEFCERASQALDNANHRVTEARELANPATGNTNPPDVSPVDLGAAATLGGAAALAAMSFKLGVFDHLRKRKSKPQGSVNDAAADVSPVDAGSASALVGPISADSKALVAFTPRFRGDSEPIKKEETSFTEADYAKEVDEIDNAAAAWNAGADKKLKELKSTGHFSLEIATNAESIRDFRDWAESMEQAAVKDLKNAKVYRRLKKRELAKMKAKLEELRQSGTAAEEDIAGAERKLKRAELRADVVDKKVDKLREYQKAAKAFFTTAEKLKPKQ